MDTRFRIVGTVAGHVGVVTTEHGLRRVYLPERNRLAMKRAIRADFPHAVEDAHLLPELAGELGRYFRGEPIEFHVRCDWSGFGAFKTDVWRACQEIGYGQTDSYKGLAEHVGRPGGARAVGLAMSHNPCPIVVPCHRVVKSDGSLGGYSGPGGVDLKRLLLDMESSVPVAT